MAQPLMDTTSVFSRGVCKGTSASGTADAIIFGLLQDLKVSMKRTLEKMYGTNNFPAAVVSPMEEITCTYKTGSYQLGLMKQATGGTNALASGITTLTKGINNDLPIMDVHCYWNTTGATVANAADLVLYGCVHTAFDLDFTNSKLMQASGSFEVVGNGTNVAVWKKFGDDTAT